MGKITGLESIQDVPPKVLLLYEAVEQLIMEDVDISDIRVSTITDKAGIGKGTAYDYFDTKEELLACAVVFYIRKAMEKLKGRLMECSSFAEQVALLLEGMEKGDGKQQCFIRYIHMMTDKSSFSCLVREKVNMESAREFLPAGVLAAILEEGQERGEVRKDLPVEYMVYLLFSRMISYMICFGEESIVGLELHKVHPFICQGILDELCNSSAKK